MNLSTILSSKIFKIIESLTEYLLIDNPIEKGCCMTTSLPCCAKLAKLPENHSSELFNPKFKIAQCVCGEVISYIFGTN